jgi:hypothetical protein
VPWLNPWGFRCLSCGREFKPWSLDYFCPFCGFPAGSLEIFYEYRKLSATFPQREKLSLWRYEALLPVGGISLRPLGPGLPRFIPPQSLPRNWAWVGFGSRTIRSSPQVPVRIGARRWWWLRPKSSAGKRFRAPPRGMPRPPFRASPQPPGSLATFSFPRPRRGQRSPSFWPSVLKSSAWTAPMTRRLPSLWRPPRSSGGTTAPTA